MSRSRRHGMMVTPQRARERVSSAKSSGKAEIVGQAIDGDTPLCIGTGEDLDAADVAAHGDDGAFLGLAALPQGHEALVVRALWLEQAARLIGGQAGQAHQLQGEARVGRVDAAGQAATSGCPTGRPSTWDALARMMRRLAGQR